VTVGSRTDPDIVRDILQALNEDVGVPKNRIRVTVKDGFVRLEWKVDWIYQLERAVADTGRTFGVRGVSSTIAVNGQNPAPEWRNGSVPEGAGQE
jgi:osmotically-inducible protein OsmY